MQIGCTKKLLDHIKVKPQEVDSSVDPILSWSAHLLMVHHRRTILVVNEASQYRFLLYGMKKKDLANIEMLFLEGVRQCLEVEGIHPLLAERYLEELGESVTLTKTKNRSVVARLNRAANRVYFKEDLLDPESLHQKHLLRILNHDYFTVNEQFLHAEEEFAGRLSERYQIPPYRCVAGEFTVSLDLHTPCTRRVIIPLLCNFHDFHGVLQQLFSWRGYHMHEFLIETDPEGRPRYSLGEGEPEYLVPGERFDSDRVITLSELFPEKETITYIYDFGDYWKHTIHLERIIEDYESMSPVCLDWEGESPPEDVGGVLGYEEFLRIMDNPDDEEYELTKRWAEGMRHIPFDLEKVNRSLKYSLR